MLIGFNKVGSSR